MPQLHHVLGDANAVSMANSFCFYFFYFAMWSCQLHAQPSSLTELRTGFEIRVVLVDWLLFKAGETRLPCYFTHHVVTFISFWQMLLCVCMCVTGTSNIIIDTSLIKKNKNTKKIVKAYTATYFTWKVRFKPKWGEIISVIIIFIFYFLFFLFLINKKDFSLIFVIFLWRYSCFRAGGA